MTSKAASLARRRVIRYSALFASLISALLTPLIDFGFINNLIVKWSIYAILVISVSINTLPQLWNLFPERAKYRAVRNTIIKALDQVCLFLDTQQPGQYRACIFVLAHEKEKTISISYTSTNMDGANDVDLAFERRQGCTGTAWAENRPVVSDLTLLDQEGSPHWGLTEKQKELTRDLKAVLSFPICHPHSTKPIAILSIDSKDNVAEFFLRQKTLELVGSYANIFGDYLVAIGDPHPLN